ncbi:MAG: BamA/TamA family outer membrane protein [Lysobacterales bacterium]|jgi:translocation and assembly module TamA
MTPPRLRSPSLRTWLCCLLLGAAFGAQADELTFAVQGISDPLLGNLRARIDPLRVSGDERRLSERRLQRIREQAENEARVALRPYGFYHPTVQSRLVPAGERAWRIELTVDHGPPVLVESARIEITGPGARRPELAEWKAEWPLTPGRRLDQTVWETEKQNALDIAETHGYLLAEFTTKTIEADLERNRAALTLVLDTGPRAVMGTIDFRQDIVRPGVLDLLPRFSAGQPYDAWLLDRLRLDLWNTGYFENVEIMEERRLEEDPPTVNLVVNTTPRKRNTYQGSLGYGTDTGIRAQVFWNQHRLSSRGDKLDMGLGWQETYQEYSFRTNYRLPRRARAREYWTADLLLGRKEQDLRVKENDTDSDYVNLSSGAVDDYSLKAGRLIVRDFQRGYQQILETWFAQYLYEHVSARLDSSGLLGMDDPQRELPPQFTNDTNMLALGVSWDWPAVHGSAFGTAGHHERAWVVTANKAWGSGVDFTQAYFSTNWHHLFGDRWKLLLRGEIGYTDAHVDDITLEVGDRTLDLSLTELPNLYRFKAGGSRSVRGYDFETLSNNGIGSNNIITASAELEMKIRPKWSVAAFFDAGNAFNDWDSYALRKGAGVGIRWYSIAGAIRLDFAQAMDLAGDPWRIHFTLGTPLL